MSTERNNDIVAKAKKQFDKDFFTEGYIDIISDDKHLEEILNNLNVESNNRILDLGTGSGYIAFPLADKSKEIEVVGLDIVDNTIIINNEMVKEKAIRNLKFDSYDGIMKGYEEEIIKSYDVEIIADRIYITEDVLNISFRKTS